MNAERGNYIIMGIQESNKIKISLEKFVKASKLSDDWKTVWYDFIRVVDDREANLVLDTLNDDSSALLFLTENITSKLNAVAVKDASAWQKIVEQEKEYLNKLES